MKILPLAADSLGTRSMATFVETGDVNILIDPAVSLGPKRYSLPPHPLEYEKMDEHRANTKKYAASLDIHVHDNNGMNGDRYFGDLHGAPGVGNIDFSILRELRHGGVFNLEVFKMENIRTGKIVLKELLKYK